MSHWAEYYATVGDKPNTALVKTLDRFGANLRKQRALDLGAGNLRDSKYLLSQGFKSVTAVDREPPPGEVPEGITSILQPLEQYLPMPNEFDLVCTFHTMYFFPETVATVILTRAYNALAEGGVMVFDLLADSDDWAGKGNRHGFAESRLTAMLSGIPEKQIRRTTGPKISTDGQERHGDIWFVVIHKQAAR